MGGEEIVAIAVLGSLDAELLGRAAGETFLETERIVYDRLGGVVECVTSLLDPAHFQLRRTLGQRP